jgi:hypothetical protein
MRLVHAVLCVILILFAAVQYNDDDWYYWGPVYLVAAYWSYLAFRSPERLAGWPAARYGAFASIVLFLIGFAWLAPTINANWIHVEEAREAFGYLICAFTTGLAVWDARRRIAAANLLRGAT